MLRTVLAGFGLALALSVPAQGAEVHIYSSLPLQGASRTQATAAVNGMRLALKEAGGRAGPFDVRYTSLDDSTRQAGNWDPATTARNARRAARDASTVLYLGEFNSGGSAISIPILNSEGIPQISPSNTYPGLTTSGPGTERGEPDRYYPSGKPTYVRLLPQDAVQSAALATQMRDDGCRRVAIAADGETYGKGIAVGVRSATRRLGVPVVRFVRSTRRQRVARVAAGVARARSDCFLFAGVTANRGPALFTSVGRRRPKARLYGGDGVCESGTTRRIRRLAARFRCTVVPLSVESYPGGQGVADAYRAAYGGGSPDPYAVLGYEAMKLGLDTIAALGGRGSDREAVREALLATRDRQSVLGTYSFTPAGDTTMRSYGIYRATRAGRVVFDHAITAG
jgi:branched-chain amino acid transport system substrate-binding protein